MNYVCAKQATQIYKVTPKTLRRWAKNNQIKFITTKGGHRRYKIPQTKTRQKIIYARVSSKKQENDLERQVTYLKKKYPTHTVIKDIGSGINFKRKGLQKILGLLFEENVSEIVVYSKDRLSRFANDLLEYLFKYFGASIIYENIRDPKTSTNELTEDLMSVITVFTSRYYGSR